jgi:hypothetical protein
VSLTSRISLSTALSLAALSFSGIARADIVPVTINDPSFENGVLNPTTGAYCYSPLGSCPGNSGSTAALASGTPGWTFGDGSGLAGNNSGFNNNTAPDGNNVAFIQGASSTVSQVLNLSVGEVVQFSFSAMGRNAQDGPNELGVFFDGTQVGDFTPATGSYQTFTTDPYTFTGIDETLTFEGLTVGGDHTSFVDTVSGTAATPEPGTFGMLLSASGLLILGLRKKAGRA